MSDTDQSSNLLDMWSTNLVRSKADRFPFFDTILKKPAWSSESFKVLDIGAGPGLFLKDATKLNSLKPEQYHCLEVDSTAIAQGKELFPTANWHYHNAFNHMYNAAGADNLRFPFDDDMFDVVMAYSVYSHATFEQMMFDMYEMIRVCKPAGKIAFTVVDNRSVEFFINKRKSDYPGKTCVTLSDFSHVDQYTYMVDNDLVLDHVFNKVGVEHLVTVYNLSWLSEHLQNQGIDHIVKFPTTGHIQRTIVIEKPLKN